MTGNLGTRFPRNLHSQAKYFVAAGRLLQGAWGAVQAGNVYNIATEEDYKDYEFNYEQEDNYDTGEVGIKFIYTEQWSSNGGLRSSCTTWWTIGGKNKLIWEWLWRPITGQTLPGTKIFCGQQIWAWRTAWKWRAVQWDEWRQTEKAKLEIHVRFQDKLTTVELWLQRAVWEIICLSSTTKYHGVHFDASVLCLVGEQHPVDGRWSIVQAWPGVTATRKDFWYEGMEENPRLVLS